MKGLYLASIYHKRQHPKEHRFTYSGYYITLDIDRMHELKNPVFGVNSFNLLSLYSKDHGYKDDRPLRGLVQASSRGFRNCIRWPADKTTDLPSRAGLRIQPGQLLLLLQGRQTGGCDCRSEQYVRRVTCLCGQRAR